MRALEVFPGIELVPVAGVPSAVAIRDAAPDQNKLLFDGFEIPTLLRGGRAIFARDISAVWVEADGFGVERGRATGGLVEVFPQPGEHKAVYAELTGMDATVAAEAPGLVMSLRGSFFEPRGVPVEIDGSSHYIDAQIRKDWKLSPSWSTTASAITSGDNDRTFERATLTSRYVALGWRGLAAVSYMHDSDVGHYVDTRAELRRFVYHALGMYRLEVRAGEDTQWVIDHHLYAGTWAATTAELTRHVSFIGGVRADAFEHQVTVQPRGMLALDAAGITWRLAAGAYRRPAMDDVSTPQRATQVAFSVAKSWGMSHSELTAYYVDRERLMVDGKATGVATNVGIEVREVVRQGPWRARLGISYSHATRADRPTAPAHAADYDLPLHVDALASWEHGSWLLGARVQLCAGLPYTPVTGSVYDADTDGYSPLYGKVMSERAPWRRELDVRADRWLLPNLRAYADLQLDGGVLGYTYSYDYSQRLAVRAPAIVPWVGLWGNL